MELFKTEAFSATDFALLANQQPHNHENMADGLDQNDDLVIPELDSVLDPVLEIPLIPGLTLTKVTHFKSDDPLQGNSSQANQNPVPALRKLPIWHGDMKLMWKTLEHRSYKEHFVENQGENDGRSEAEEVGANQQKLDMLQQSHHDFQGDHVQVSRLKQDTQQSNQPLEFVDFVPSPKLSVLEPSGRKMVKNTQTQICDFDENHKCLQKQREEHKSYESFKESNEEVPRVDDPVNQYF